MSIEAVPGGCGGVRVVRAAGESLTSPSRPISCPVCRAPGGGRRPRPDAGRLSGQLRGPAGQPVRARVRRRRYAVPGRRAARRDHTPGARDRGLRPTSGARRPRGRGGDGQGGVGLTVDRLDGPRRGPRSASPASRGNRRCRPARGMFGTHPGAQGGGVSAGGSSRATDVSGRVSRRSLLVTGSAADREGRWRGRRDAGRDRAGGGCRRG